MATTLIFVSAVTGNYASYVSYNHSHTASTEAVDSWYYDINKASLLDCSAHTTLGRPCTLRLQSATLPAMHLSPAGCKLCL